MKRIDKHMNNPLNRVEEKNIVKHNNYQIYVYMQDKKQLDREHIRKLIKTILGGVGLLIIIVYLVLSNQVGALLNVINLIFRTFFS